MAHGLPTNINVLDLPIKRICENLNVVPSTARRLIALFDSTGMVDAKPYPDHQANSRRKLSEIDQIFVIELVLDCPGVYLKGIFLY